MNDYSMKQAYQLGAYRAIAEMMRTEIRKLNDTLADKDNWMSEYHMRNLVSLADQLDAAEAKHKEEFNG